MKKITLKLKIENITEEQAIAIVNMMQEMEAFGYRGHSAYVGLFADGDGNFHPHISNNLYDYSEDDLREFKDSTCVYEGHSRTNSDDKTFPWTDSITLFDWENLNLHK